MTPIITYYCMYLRQYTSHWTKSW